MKFIRGSWSYFHIIVKTSKDGKIQFDIHSGKKKFRAKKRQYLNSKVIIFAHFMHDFERMIGFLTVLKRLFHVW